VTTQDPYGQADWRNPYGQYGADPYGQHVQYGPDPYAQYAQDVYAQYARALYPQPPAYQVYGPPRPDTSGLANVALVLNILAGVFTCGLGLAWLPGVILSAIAVNRGRTDPNSAQALTMVGLVCFVANFVMVLLFFVG
jgi:hypothetical protein